MNKINFEASVKLNAQYKRILERMNIQIAKFVSNLEKDIKKNKQTYFSEFKEIKVEIKPFATLKMPEFESIKPKFTSDSIVVPSLRQEDIAQNGKKLREGAYRILKAVAMFGEITKEKARTMSGISSLGTFGTYIADLQRANWIIRENDMLKITQEGMANCGEIKELPTTTEEFIELWSKFLRDGAIRMLKLAVEVYPNSISKQEIQEKSGISSNGTFGTYLADLKRNNLIQIEKQEITASKELFE